MLAMHADTDPGTYPQDSGGPAMPLFFGCTV